MNTKPRYTVRKQSSGYASSVTFFVYDLVSKGRVTVHAHTTREGAEADAARLNAAEAEDAANLADPAWVAERDAKLAAQGLAVNAAGDLVRLEDVDDICPICKTRFRNAHGVRAHRSARFSSCREYVRPFARCTCLCTECWMPRSACECTDGPSGPASGLCPEHGTP